MSGRLRGPRGPRGPGRGAAPAGRPRCPRAGRIRRLSRLTTSRVTAAWRAPLGVVVKPPRGDVQPPHETDVRAGLHVLDEVPDRRGPAGLPAPALVQPDRHHPGPVARGRLLAHAV